MKYVCTVLFTCTILTTALTAQNHRLNGYWKGHITQSTLEGELEDVVFELYLQVKDGRNVTGRSYAYLTNGEIIEMEVAGIVHGDNSVSLHDASYIALENSDLTPDHSKQYQFAHYRSAFITSNKLSGYWQEVVETAFSLKRRRGRVELHKVSNQVNKA